MNILDTLKKGFTVVKVASSNKDNIAELKQDIGNALIKGSTLLDNIMKDFNKNNLTELMGLDGNILKGNKRNVYLHYMKNCILVEIKLNPTFFIKHEISLKQLIKDTDIDIQDPNQIISAINNKREHICSGEFKTVEHNITKTYEITMGKQRYIGNNNIEFIAEASLIEKNKDKKTDKEMAISLECKIIQSGNVIFQQTEKIDLPKMESNDNSIAFNHATLPKVCNHYLSADSDTGQIVLQFTFA